MAYNKGDTFEETLNWDRKCPICGETTSVRVEPFVARFNCGFKLRLLQQKGSSFASSIVATCEVVEECSRAAVEELVMWDYYIG